MNAAAKKTFDWVSPDGIRRSFTEVSAHINNIDEVQELAVIGARMRAQSHDVKRRASKTPNPWYWE